MSESKSEQKKIAKKQEAESSNPALVKMVNAGGKVAFVHASMIRAYKSGGYKEA